MTTSEACSAATASGRSSPWVSEITPTAIELFVGTRASEPRRRCHGSIRHDVSSIQRGRRLEQEHVDFLLRDRPMLDAARNDQELPRLERDVLIAELHREATVDDQEQLVLMLVVMPHELALELHQLH